MASAAVQEALGLADGETIQWKKKANRWQSSVRSVGGHLYLTDRRLIFLPHAFDAATKGEAWEVALNELQGASPYGLLRWIDLEYKEGGIERFVIWPPKKTLLALNAAIQDATD